MLVNICTEARTSLCVLVFYCIEYVAWLENHKAPQVYMLLLQVIAWIKWILCVKILELHLTPRKPNVTIVVIVISINFWRNFLSNIWIRSILHLWNRPKCKLFHEIHKKEKKTTHKIKHIIKQDGEKLKDKLSLNKGQLHNF